MYTNQKLWLTSYVLTGLFGLAILVAFSQAAFALDLAPHSTMVDAEKVLPTFVPDPCDIGQAIELRLCVNEFEPASFVMRSDTALSGVTAEVSALVSTQATLSSDVVDIHWVKCWYQNGTTSLWFPGPHEDNTLTPELLLKDPCMVQVDLVNELNTVIPVDSGSGFPADATTLQPLALPADFAQQVWLTVKVPDGTLPGTYSGTVTVKVGGTPSATLPIQIEVLDFLLQDSMLDHGLYASTRWASQIANGSRDRVLVEMANLRDHGINRVGLREDADQLAITLPLMRHMGLPTDEIYIFNCSSPLTVPHATTVEGVQAINPADVATRATTWIQAAQNAGGVEEVFLYLIDEAHGEVLAAEEPLADAIHNAGAKTWVAGWQSDLLSGGSFVDSAVASAAPTAGIAAQYHASGRKVYCYNNPQGGVEYPEIYRRNFGLLLWQNDYDGGMNFGYYWAMGPSIYDDFDHNWRDHCMAYPTVDGLIDTIQWEGWREGYDDCRYIATLQHYIDQARLGLSIDVADAAQAWLDSLKAGGSDALADLETVREQAIDYIQQCSQSRVLQLRDGWDPINWVADPVSGYYGTRDDTGTHGDYSALRAGSPTLIAYMPACASVVGFDISAYADNIDTLNSATLVMTFAAASWWGNEVTWAVRNPDKQWVEDEAYFYKASIAAGLWNDWEGNHGMRMLNPNVTTTTVAAGPNTSSGRTGETVSFDVTSLVQTWLDDSANNRGFAVMPVIGGASNYAHWGGRTYDVIEYRPMLALNYQSSDPLTCQEARQAGFGLMSDLNGDCYVDLADFAALAAEWTSCRDPQNGDCDDLWNN